MDKSVNSLEAFRWSPQPRAAALVRELVEEILSSDPVATDLSLRMKEETGTRFGDWIDHISVSNDQKLFVEMGEAGYAKETASDRSEHFVQRAGLFPAIVVRGRLGIALKVESIVDFAAANGLPLKTNDSPLAAMRWLEVSEHLSVVERHGFRGYVPLATDAGRALRLLHHLEIFRTRKRDFVSDELGFAHAGTLIDTAIVDVGVDATCDLFFQAEREFWQRRNHAAQVQKARQDRLGLGWGNHDHHTYRSSRRNFVQLVGLFEKLGFVCRERFYAGQQAGWGAQVMEQAETGIITFNDVDLTPDELTQDFAHQPLAEQKKLGTVGLWCALHGDSFLQAGMHHLEAQFDFQALRDQLEAEAGVKTMKPFTNFQYLRQAFTEGERWKVSEARLARVLADGQITSEQAERFRAEGAIGSHLENLERNDGFKGFNQTGVSEIISATDPRKHLKEARNAE